MNITELEPKKVFEYFALLSSVPHGSGNTGKIADICENFAKERGLRYQRDELNNIIIFKDGAKGYENHSPIIIQGHLDMVCASADDCKKDMSKEGIELAVDNGYLHAVGTSLGADDGLAVAMAMALLDSDDIPYPPLECVFTVDEETGMFGAAGIDVSSLKAKAMINIDSEDEGVFTVGCAGGIRINCTYNTEKTNEEGIRKRITVSGLKGGHSGAEINCGRGSANKLLARTLHYLAFDMGEDISLCSWKGGKFDNVITPTAYADIFFPEWEESSIISDISEINKILSAEYALTDPDVVVTISDTDCTNPPIESHDILSMFFVLPQGVQGMSFAKPGLVETSCNLGVINLDENGLRFSLSVRSSVETKKNELAGIIETIVSDYGCDFSESGDYPGWEYAPISPLRDLFAETYKEMTGKEARVEAIHAGLECGFFASKIDGLDCVSLGPNLHDIHTFNERAEIDSVRRTYELVKNVLKKL